MFASFSFDRRIPTSKDSYSASFFDVWKSRRTAYVAYLPMRLFRTRISRDPSLMEAPSVCNFQYSAIWSGGDVVFGFPSLICFIVYDMGILTKKSTNVCALMLALGLFLMACSPSSMTYLANRPDFSGFDGTWRMGWVVGTSMWCAWKYLHCPMAVCTSVSTNFSSIRKFNLGACKSLLTKCIISCFHSRSTVRTTLIASSDVAR